MSPFRPVAQALSAEVFLSPSASPSHGTRVTNHECRSIPQIEKLSHLAELLVAHLKQFTEGLIRQRRQLPVQHFIQEPRRPFVVGVRAALRLRNDLVTIPSSFKSFAVIFMAAAAVSAFVESRQMIEAHPSGEITE